jgi:hypothetical protein
MKVDRNAVIGGQPLKVVREMVRKVRLLNIDAIIAHLQKSWCHAFVEQLFEQGVINREARNYSRQSWSHLKDKKRIYGVQVPEMPDMTGPAYALFDHLLSDGYIEPTTGDVVSIHDHKVNYKLTIKGEALRITRFIRRISRAEAEALLKSVLERVAAINADPEMLHFVTEVRVFGSYLTDSADLGDLDLAADYCTRPVKPNPDQLGSFRAACVALAKKHGKDIEDERSLFAFPEQLLKRRITNGSAHISLHGIYELNEHPDLFRSEPVYTFAPPEADL